VKKLLILGVVAAVIGLVAKKFVGTQSVAA
jgi:hypothetical protein